jgi:hypothetical protein
MINLDKAHHLIETAIAEFAPDWEVIGECTELTVREPDDWMSGSGSYGVTLQNRLTGALKLVGKRRGAHGTADCARGVSFRVLEAYGERNTDPIVRFLQEIGLVHSGRHRGPSGSRGTTSGPSAARGGRPSPSRSAGAHHSRTPAPGPRSAPPAPSFVPEPPPARTSAERNASSERSAPASERRGRSNGGRRRLKEFLSIRPATLKRMLRRKRRGGDDVEVRGQVMSGSTPVLDLTRVTPTIDVSGKAVRLVLTFADGEGEIVFECNRVVNAEFAGQTGEKALASILAAYGVRQRA